MFSFWEVGDSGEFVADMSNEFKWMATGFTAVNGQSCQHTLTLISPSSDPSGEESNNTTPLTIGGVSSGEVQSQFSHATNRFLEPVEELNQAYHVCT